MNVEKKSKIPSAPTITAFQTVFGKATVIGHAAQSNVTADQPVGYAAAYAAAKRRIAYIRSVHADLTNNVPVVAVEGFIQEAVADSTMPSNNHAHRQRRYTEREHERIRILRGHVEKLSSEYNEIKIENERILKELENYKKNEKYFSPKKIRSRDRERREKDRKRDRSRSRERERRRDREREKERRERYEADRRRDRARY